MLEYIVAICRIVVLEPLYNPTPEKWIASMDSKDGRCVMKWLHWKGSRIGQTVFSPCNSWLEVKTAIMAKTAFWILGLKRMLCKHFCGSLVLNNLCQHLKKVSCIVISAGQIFLGHLFVNLPCEYRSSVVENFLFHLCCSTHVNTGPIVV